MLKRKFIYAAAFAGVFCMNIFYTDYQPFFVLWIMLLFPIVMYAYVFMLSRKVTLLFHIEGGEAIRGDRMRFFVRIENSTILPASNITFRMSFRYGNCEAPTVRDFSVNAKAMDATKIEGSIVMNYCGNLEASIEDCYLYDPVRLFRMKLKVKGGEEVTVMPVLSEPDLYTMYAAPEIETETHYYSNKTPGDDSSEIFDVREYRDGDNISHVHWKLSAKEDNLFVKEYSLPVSRSNVILLELYQNSTEEERRNLDGVYEMAYAIGNYACLREKIFNIAYYSVLDNGIKMIEVNSMEMLIEAVEIVIQEQLHSREICALREFLAEGTEDCERLYYITPLINDDVLSFMEDSSGMKAYVYHMGDGVDESHSLQSEGALLVCVDRNDIRVGLKSVLI